MTETIPLRSNITLYRFIAITIAGALLNIGFYFILFVLTPIFSGIVVGFLLGHVREGAVAGFTSSLIAFLPLLFYLAPLLIPFPTPDLGFYIALVSSSLFFSVLGLVSGIIGALISMKARQR